MINKECFSTEWITKKSIELKYNDKNLIEKVIRAFSLLEMLATSGCPFHFKGGTSLMLILGGGSHRLSIDIDIMCPPGTNIEDYLKDYAQNGFLDYQLVERRQAGKDVPKSHSKFFYQVAFKGQTDATSFILLDVLYEDCHYQKTNTVDIVSPFIELDGEPMKVNVPSVEDILGDKLTAFALETTGIPYYKKDRLSTLEVIKQLYDVGRLFDKMQDLNITSRSFKAIAEVELGYRDLGHDLSQIYQDIRQTALNISTRGYVDKEKFALLQKGIINIKPFIYMGAYRIEEAIIDAAKAAYLATLIETGAESLERFSANALTDDIQIKPVLTNKLNKLHIGLPEAYFYWAKTSELLDNMN
ncbi:MAG: nucleotidyl transferase AbiEii/AbiGii toxin family protein [Bacteroidaceae bacterium]|nr:nucleotidyl transferase AbiEii/AbiGii toxin family protein [Bacteroidaceae bacterium]